ncbi:MAG: hypothetical protein EBQ92_07505 [Proteobacteria bacterium]|nr:hypothetical protein [Pseudomonadota bacterium]
MFNFDPWRYWLNGFQGVDFFNREVRFEKPINYVSLNPMFLGLLSPKERAYLTKNYEAKGCFWKRKIN